MLFAFIEVSMGQLAYDKAAPATQLYPVVTTLTFLMGCSIRLSPYTAHPKEPYWYEVLQHAKQGGLKKQKDLFFKDKRM